TLCHHSSPIFFRVFPTTQQGVLHFSSTPPALRVCLAPPTLPASLSTSNATNNPQNKLDNASCEARDSTDPRSIQLPLWEPTTFQRRKLGGRPEQLSPLAPTPALHSSRLKSLRRHNTTLYLCGRSFRQTTPPPHRQREVVDLLQVRPNLLFAFLPSLYYSPLPYAFRSQPGTLSTKPSPAPACHPPQSIFALVSSSKLLPRIAAALQHSYLALNPYLSLSRALSKNQNNQICYPPPL
ncbi:hypothetical protein R3P38DRAFT_3419801, partial [Favolaschia claudopus]